MTPDFRLFKTSCLADGLPVSSYWTYSSEKIRESSARSAAIRARSPSSKSFMICCWSVSICIKPPDPALLGDTIDDVATALFLLRPDSVQAGLYEEDSVIRMLRAFTLLLFLTIIRPIAAHAQSVPPASGKPF